MRPLLRRAKGLPGKDAGSVRIRSDTGATEDAAWQSLAAAGGDGVDCLKGRLQKPEAGREQPAGVGLPVRRRPAAEQLVFAAAPQGEGDPLPQRLSVTLVGALVLACPGVRDRHGAALLDGAVELSGEAIRNAVQPTARAPPQRRAEGANG